jgi:hypothetical protein
MLFAIWRICFFECVRALFGCGRNSRTDVYSIFISFLSNNKLSEEYRKIGLIKIRTTLAQNDFAGLTVGLF